MAAKGERKALGSRAREVELSTDKAANPALASIEMIPIDAIRVDGGTQMRAALREETIGEYHEIMEMAEGWGDFPAVEVVYDGTTYWMTDGFHRHAAAIGLIAGAIPARVLAGDQRFAVKRAMAANAIHGLRRSNADKRRSVMTALMDDEWGALTDGVIAEMCAVSARYVGMVRGEMQKMGEITERSTRVGGDGRAINVEKIGHTPKAAAKPKPTPAPVAEPVVRFADRPERPDAEPEQMGTVMLLLSRPVAMKLRDAAGLGVFAMFLTPSEVRQLEQALRSSLVEEEG